MSKTIACLTALALCACNMAESPQTGEAQQEIVSYTFSTHEVLDTSSSPADYQRGTDPFVRVASNGDIYVGATSFPRVAALLSDGGSLWRSTDSGSTWSYLGTANLVSHTGAETAMDIDDNGHLWMAELDLGPDVLPIYRYDNPSAIINRATDYSAQALGTPASERAFISSYGDRIHVQYGEAQVIPGVRVSFHGSTNPPVFTATIPLVQSSAMLAETAGGTNTSTMVAGYGQGPLAVNKSTGAMCAPVLSINGSTSGDYLPAHSLWTACSTDALTWTNTLVYKNVNVSLMNFWPASAIDAAGNFYFVVAANMDSTGAATTGVNIFLFTSTDGGATWSAPKQVNSGTSTNVFPVAVAGCSGGVDILWYGTSTASAPSSMPSTAEWHVYMAQSKNATTASPTWNQIDVLADSADGGVSGIGTISHYGPINNKGTYKSGDVDYRILTLPGITLNSSGAANIIWEDTHTTWSINPNAGPLSADMGNPFFGPLYHSRQTSGPKLDMCP